jgi:hypothetical protein
MTLLEHENRGIEPRIHSEIISMRQSISESREFTARTI